MKINYWILIGIIAVCVLIAIVIIESNNKNQKKKSSLVDCLFLWVLFGLPVSGIICWVLSLLAGTVYYVEDENKYSDTDYLIWYTSPQGETHFVVPFCTYIENNSSEDVRITQYGYGNLKDEVYPVYDYAPNTFSRMEETPTIFFMPAPLTIRTKGRGDVRTVLDYASHSSDEYYNINGY